MSKIDQKKQQHQKNKQVLRFPLTDGSFYGEDFFNQSEIALFPNGHIGCWIGNEDFFGGTTSRPLLQSFRIKVSVVIEEKIEIWYI